MARSLEARWGAAQHRAQVGTPDELDALLDRLDEEARRGGRPQDVQLFASDGAGILWLVVGDERSVVGHTPAHLNPPYMISRGDDESAGVFTFYVAGDHHSEALNRNTVPASSARDAALRFLLEGTLDDRIVWEEG